MEYYIVTSYITKHGTGFLFKLSFPLWQLPPPMHLQRRIIFPNHKPRRRRQRNHHAFLGPEPEIIFPFQAFPGSNSRVRTPRRLAVASADHLLHPHLQPIRSRPPILRRALHHEIPGKVGGFPSGVRREIIGENWGGEIFGRRD